MTLSAQSRAPSCGFCLLQRKNHKVNGISHRQTNLRLHSPRLPLCILVHAIAFLPLLASYHPAKVCKYLHAVQYGSTSECSVRRFVSQWTRPSASCISPKAARRATPQPKRSSGSLTFSVTYNRIGSDLNIIDACQRLSPLSQIVPKFQQVPSSSKFPGRR
ncbi:hypothetical protein FIBSPDRAFT_863587 [Athelia psychrophila]|uniref:Uncharacterized protein n=1 Tax=Athelia psychrophila TaxID=1759441 RepID=A0A166H7F6_9AGAM|nr:hypothetical protein FIBSPDRAFT_863587 [Fibularhizoctonia sp. CBS 109695]